MIYNFFLIILFDWLCFMLSIIKTCTHWGKCLLWNAENFPLYNTTPHPKIQYSTYSPLWKPK